MRTFFRAGLSAVALIAAPAVSAYAGDMSPPAGQGGFKDAPAYAATNWSGFYGGVNGGYGWSSDGSSMYAYANDGGLINRSPVATYDRSGGFGGGQIGYNFQMNRFVFGVEADIQASTIAGNVSANASAGNGDVVANARRESSLDWFGTARGRLGYSLDRTLIYFTGGFAYGGNRATNSVTLDDRANGGGVFTYSPSSAGTRAGYVLGAGIEYALSGNWSIKGEYQYMDLGTSGGYFGVHNTAGGIQSISRAYVTTDHDFNTVRAGLNYHLNTAYEPLK